MSDEPKGLLGEGFSRRAVKTTFLRPSLSTEEKSRLADNCLGGEPTLIADDFGETHLIVREGYALRHSNALKIPLFVCQHIEPTEPGPGAPRPGWRTAENHALAASRPPNKKVFILISGFRQAILSNSFAVISLPR